MPQAKRHYTHQRCGVCRDLWDFKLLLDERDEHERSLMVCTRCNHKTAAPGQVKQVWRPSQDGLA